MARCQKARGLWKTLSVLVLLAVSIQLSAREKEAVQYGAGLTISVPYSESVVAQVLHDVVQDGIIHGSKEYNKDEYIAGAEAAESTKVFSPWKEGGKVFYKVRRNTIDPRNFKESQDVGTLAVRYVVQPQGEKNSVLRIDALFVEDFRHVAHPSNGSVESAEYKDIHDRLETLELLKEQTAEAEKAKGERLPNKDRGVLADVAETPASAPAVDSPPANDVKPPIARNPEEHLRDLRRQLERLVKAPGAPLKTAPFHSATTLQTLDAGTEVLVVITTTYWLGVETHDGQHGWILRDQLEQLP